MDRCGNLGSASGALCPYLRRGLQCCFFAFDVFVDCCPVFVCALSICIPAWWRSGLPCWPI